MDAVAFTFSRPDTTLAVTRGVGRMLTAMGHAPLMEICLPNGRRADIMALGPRGEIAIVEVKSSFEDYRVDRKWGDYLPFCDAFYFAVAPEFPMAMLPDDAGLIVGDAFDGAILREARPTPLSGPRRKALTLAFARLAAMRVGVE